MEREVNMNRDVEAKLAKIKAAMPDLILAAHKHSSRHRDEVVASDQCGCFYCGRLFSSAEITKWIDQGRTALCPRCGIDAVIGSASGFPLTKEFLNEMNGHWF
jgi:hypothetical protein